MYKFRSLITPIFLMQVLMSSSVIAFCMIQIARGSELPVYWSTTTLLIGFWMPTPLRETKL
jgi:hypothetical protein